MPTLTDLGHDIRQSIACLKASPFLSVDDVQGFVYDVVTGPLREVT